MKNTTNYPEYVYNCKARVLNGQTGTDVFPCQKSLKQGEVTSPHRFLLFINELAQDIIRKEKHGVHIFPDLVELFILRFADGIVLLSDTIAGLQTQLNTLARKASDLDLYVNLHKPYYIVIFRNGGYIAKREIWYYNGQAMTVVNCYKYLGVFLTTRMSFLNAFDDMASKARRSVVDLFRALWRLGDHSSTIFLKLFDAQIAEMLS